MDVVKKYFNDSSAPGDRYWLACEAQELIEVFGSHCYLFGVMTSSDDVWELIASALRKRGIAVTARQAKRKWQCMRGTYDRISRARLLKPLKLCSHVHDYDPFGDCLPRVSPSCPLPLDDPLYLPLRRRPYYNYKYYDYLDFVDNRYDYLSYLYDLSRY